MCVRLTLFRLGAFAITSAIAAPDSTDLYCSNCHRKVTILMTFDLASPTSPFSVQDFLQDAIGSGPWDPAPPAAATLFVCSEESRTVFKDLSQSGFTLRVAQPQQWDHALSSIPTAAPTKIHTVVVDWQCPNIGHLMPKAASLTMLRSPYRWLVLNITSEEHAEEDAEGSCQDLAQELSANGSALAPGRATDADVVLVCRGAAHLILVDLWGHGSPTVLGKWLPGVGPRFQSDRHPPAVRRLAVGLNGYVFRTAFVITNNDSYNHLTDGFDRRSDFLSKFHYEVMHVLVKMLNASIIPVFTQRWGHYINGRWDGLVALQVRREAELGGTGSTPNDDRIKVQTYLNYVTPATGTFLLKEPPISNVLNIFILPFPQSVWLASAALLLLGYILLYVDFRLEDTGVIGSVDLLGPTGTRHATWSDVALIVIGAACQQGYPSMARGLSGRIVTLFLFLGILFLYTSYSASIVALLQSTTSNFRHYKDFLNSPIELGAHDTSYNRYFLSTNNDTYRRRVYLEKFIKHGRRDPYVSLESGLQNVLKSYFAFFAIRSEMYQVISDTFQEHEKCGLQEVDHNFAGITYPQTTVPRWSAHAELVRIALRKIQERGVRQRQIQKFVASKPVCVNRGGNFQSISMIDCYGAFMVLLGGIGLALLLLLVEVGLAVRAKLKRQATLRRNAWLRRH